VRALDTDYLVVGAGAMGMTFTDALIDHADVHVTLVDRRHAPGGHWQDAYPFVRLHQASLFYGVASIVLGSGAIQQHGPEAGLHERAGADEIRAYSDAVLQRLLASEQSRTVRSLELLGLRTSSCSRVSVNGGSCCVARTAGPLQCLPILRNRSRPPLR
jgi:cation diffusion facilitator CzcD-associated flavoprotein CzcO